MSATLRLRNILPGRAGAVCQAATDDIVDVLILPLHPSGPRMGVIKMGSRETPFSSLIIPRTITIEVRNGSMLSVDPHLK